MDAWKALCPAGKEDVNLCAYFNEEELKTAMQTMKQEKVPGPDKLHPEFFMHLYNLCLTWLTTQFSICLSLKNVPKIWTFLKNVAILKPNKPANKPKS